MIIKKITNFLKQLKSFEKFIKSKKAQFNVIPNTSDIYYTCPDCGRWVGGKVLYEVGDSEWLSKKRKYCDCGRKISWDNH